jgi:hypothetical protein
VTPEAAFFGETPYDPARARAFREEFDAGLGGRVSNDRLQTAQRGRRGRRRARGVGFDGLGPTRSRAIELALDPRRTGCWAVLELTTHAKLPRALVHASYVRKLSHTADSQISATG